MRDLAAEFQGHKGPRRRRDGLAAATEAFLVVRAVGLSTPQALKDARVALTALTRIKAARKGEWGSGPWRREYDRVNKWGLRKLGLL